MTGRSGLRPRGRRSASEPGGGDPGPPRVARARVLAVAPDRARVRRIAADAEVVAPAAAVVRSLSGGDQGAALQLTRGVPGQPPGLPELPVLISRRPTEGHVAFAVGAATDDRSLRVPPPGAEGTLLH